MNSYDEAEFTFSMLYLAGTFVTFGAIVKTWGILMAAIFSAFWPFYWLAMGGYKLASLAGV